MKKIVLDCDGVLLDYNKHFGLIYEKAFGKKLTPVNPNAYHAHDYWGVKLLKEEKQHFYDVFDKEGWGTMPPMEGALEACKNLKENGFVIYIVTSMNVNAIKERVKNLRDLGIDYQEIYATGRTSSLKNPKELALKEIAPEFFVDNLITNFHDVDKKINCVLIESDFHNSPNHDLINDYNLHSIHSSLNQFVNSIFAKEIKNKVKL